MTEQSEKAHVFFGLEVAGMTPTAADQLVKYLDPIEHEMFKHFRKTISKFGVPSGEVRVLSDEEMGGVFGTVVIETNEEMPRVEPGLPLRQFIRGFLRDHLGMSKIAAHLMADLFMKRWDKRREYADRYAREDKHTEAESEWRSIREEAEELLSGC